MVLWNMVGSVDMGLVFLTIFVMLRNICSEGLRIFKARPLDRYLRSSVLYGSNIGT